MSEAILGLISLGSWGPLMWGPLWRSKSGSTVWLYDGLGGGEDGVFGVGDVLDGAVAVVVDVGHGVSSFFLL